MFWCIYLATCHTEYTKHTPTVFPTFYCVQKYKIFYINRFILHMLYRMYTSENQIYRNIESGQDTLHTASRGFTAHYVYTLQVEA